MSQESQGPPASGRMSIRVPADLSPIYANFAVITHSPSEILIDFAQAMPGVAEMRVQGRVVMTPLNAKLLLKALTEHLGRYESQHGEIQVPEGGSLAEHLFKRSDPGEADDAEDKEGTDDG